MFIFYYKYIFLIKIKIICIFLKLPENFLENQKKILYKYVLIQKYIIQTIVTDITTTTIVNDDKSKFQISPISSMLKLLSLNVKL